MKNLFRVFVCFAMLTLFAVVHAQTTSIDPCTGTTLNQPPTPPVDLLTKPLVCERETGRTYDFNSSGAIAWSYCYNSTTNKYSHRFVVASWSDLQNVPSMAKDALAAWPNATNEQIRLLLIKYNSGQITDAAHAAVWCPFLVQMKAGVPPPPQAVTWKVSLGVAFRLSGASLAGSAGSVVVGTACDCAKQTKIGSSTYCPFAGAALNVVAQCKQQ